jgi:hypothetical protein
MPRISFKFAIPANLVVARKRGNLDIEGKSNYINKYDEGNDREQTVCIPGARVVLAGADDRGNPFLGAAEARATMGAPSQVEPRRGSPQWHHGRRGRSDR